MQLNELLSAEFDGSPLVEYVDTFMYGFWGEGHTWPFTDNPFPDRETAERTFVGMLERQLESWKRTPLATNTQPDWSRVGNSELIDRTIRSHNWLRTDTIFIENEQIETISNRPPWVAAVVEAPMSDGSPESLKLDESVTYTDNVIAHVMDVGANYWSLWNWHAERAANVLSYYDKYPEMINMIARRIGYRVQPSFIWRYESGEQNGLVIGFANDGVAGVPGALRIEVRRGRHRCSPAAAGSRLSAAREGPAGALRMPAGTVGKDCCSKPSSKSKASGIPCSGHAVRPSKRTIP